MASLTTDLRSLSSLSSQIIRHRKGYDWSNDADSEYAEMRADTKVYDPNDVKRLTCIAASQQAKDDVCTVRLVCKQIRDAAYETFGTTLGHRRFRLTSTSIEDLENMGARKELAPRIKILTFGTAQLENLYCFGPEYHGYLHRENDNEAIVQQAGVKQTAFSGAKRCYEPSETQHELYKALQGFANLWNAHIVVVTEPEYLDGWLTPAQRRFMKARHETLVASGHQDFWSPRMCYRSDTEVIPTSVVCTYAEWAPTSKN